MPRTFGQGLGFVIGFWLAISLILPLGARSEDLEMRNLEAELYGAVNGFRQGQSLLVLERRADLDAVARAHSADMIARGYFSHDTPEGLNPVHRIQGAGIEGFSLAAENVGQTTERRPAHAILEGWKHSPDHLRNLIARPFNQTGVGIVRASDGRIFVTQLYLTVPRD